jgi:hypothetical protein
MLLKLRQYVETETEKIIEDHIIEHPKELSIQINREYNAEARQTGIIALFPISEKSCKCNFITYMLDNELHSYACLDDSVFLMSDSGKTIDKY